METPEDLRTCILDDLVREATSAVEKRRPGSLARSVLHRAQKWSAAQQREKIRGSFLPGLLLAKELKRALILAMDQDVTDGDAAAALGLLLAAGAAANFANENQISLLHVLASGGADGVDSGKATDMSPSRAMQLTTLLVNAGADVNDAPDSLHSATPLGWACWYGCTGGAIAMLAAGADREARDAYGRVPLFWAIQQGHTATIEAFDLESSSTPRLRAWSFSEYRRRLQGVHAGWAEEDARIEAAVAVTILSRGLSKRFGLSLPENAACLVASFVIPFWLWVPLTVPRVRS